MLAFSMHNALAKRVLPAYYHCGDRVTWPIFPLFLYSLCFRLTMAPLAVGKLKTRKIYTSKNRTPYRVRRKNEARPKLTAAEKKKLRENLAVPRTPFSEFLQKCDATLVNLTHEMAEP